MSHKKNRKQSKGRHLLERLQSADPEDAEEIMEGEMARQTRSQRATHFYVEGFSPKKGRGCFIGGFNSYEEAERVGSNKGIVGMHILEFQTSNLAQAKRIWKERKLEKGAHIDEAMENLRTKGEDVGL